MCNSAMAMSMGMLRTQEAEHTDGEREKGERVKEKDMEDRERRQRAESSHERDLVQCGAVWGSVGI